MELSKSNESCFARKSNFYEENIYVNDDEEHIEQSNNESLLLTDDIHKLSDRLEKISINELSFLKNLEEWRNEAHEKIDKLCQSRRDEYIQRTNEEIDRLREKINLLNSDHDDAAQDYIDWIKQTIEIINEQLNELQQIQSKFSPLNIENSIICFPLPISDTKHHPTPLKNLFSFSSSSTNEIFSPLSSSSSSSFNFPSIASEKTDSSFTFQSSNSNLKLPSDHWYSLSRNETNLLITGKSDLILIDHSFKIINKKSFSSIGIKDICWSKTLSKFILITPKQIYLFDEKTLSLELTSINLTYANPWERGTSSQTSLFLSTFGENPIIVEFNLSPSIHFNKKYQSTIICQETEIINDIKSNDIYLGLIIENGFNNQTRFELRSIKTFELIWSIYLGKGWGYRCSTSNFNYWILSDSYNQRIIFIDNQGNIQKIDNYYTKPFNILSLSDNQMVIRTHQGLNIHQYQ